MTNEAKKWVAKFQDQPDGENYSWLYDENNNKVRDILFSKHISTINYDADRYEFEDGSAIVSYECGWDFGIHQNHLLDGKVVETCGEYELDPKFAWCAVVNLDEKYQNA